MGQEDRQREQTEFLDMLHESIKAELRDPSTGLLGGIDRSQPDQLKDLRRMASSVEKSKVIIRSLLDHLGLDRRVVIGSLLDYDLSKLTAELINLAKGHRSKLLVPDESKPGLGRILDHPPELRLRRLGLVYLRMRKELGDSQRAASDKIARVTNGVLTLHKLRYVKSRLQDLDMTDLVDDSYDQWFSTNGGFELSGTPTPEQRRAIVSCASEEILPVLVQFAKELPS